jgi:thiol-disulfide isomerase/thioredoxin
MRFAPICLVAACIVAPLFAQDIEEGPTNEKAQKTYKEACQEMQKDQTSFALDSFKKADKQDDGHCQACQTNMIICGEQTGDWKTAEFAAGEMVAEAHGDKQTALAHFQLATVLLHEAQQKHKEELFTRADEEANKALAAGPNFPQALFLDGIALANLHQDDAAKAKFGDFVKRVPAEDLERRRALRYIAQPELARARMVPAFAVTTLDGTRISMDDLQGKVVLIDFWATWCGPCREALPHIRDIARKFQGQPLVILSVSLDSDAQKRKDFVTKNEMTWFQYRDGGFDGQLSKMFDVEAIPHTFTIDADGVVQDEHVGDASIEGRLKKLLAAARELPSAGATAN